MKDRFPESGPGVRHPGAECFAQAADVDIAVLGNDGQVVAQDDPCFAFVGLELVVEKHPFDMSAVVYSGNHCLRSSSVRDAIFSLRALSWRV